MLARTFTRRWVITVLLLILFIAAFPFVLPALARATGCQRIGGACGAVAAVFGIYLRLPVVIGVGVYLSVLTWKRARLVGSRPWTTIFVVLMYLSALPAIFSFGNFWGANFALGMIWIAQPLAALTMLLATLVALSCLPDDIEAWRGQPHTMTMISGGLALLLTMNQWLFGLGLLPFIGGFLQFALLPIQIALAPLYRLVGSSGLLIVAAALIASLSLWVITARRVQPANDGSALS